VAPPAAATESVSWALDRSTFDPAAAPCDDFYQYVCGGFDTPAHIAPDRSSADWARDAVNAANAKAIVALLTGSDDAGDPELVRLRAFYASCMATGPAADARGDAVLAAWLRRIAGIASARDFGTVMRELHAAGIAAVFHYADAPDTVDGARYRGEISEATAGLRTRMFGEAGADADQRRAAYRAHIRRMFELAGIAPAQAERDARAAFDVEAELAAIPLSNPYDVAAREHPMTPAALRALAPHIDWSAYLALVGAPPDRSINVTTPAYLAAADRMLASRPIAELRGYLRWELIQSLWRALPTRLADERERFLASPGVQPPPRTEVCQLETLKALGVELSHQFSTRSIGEAARSRAHAMAERVQGEMAASANAVTWLSPDGRAFSSDKLAQLALKIGYPDTWPETGAGPLRADAYLANALATRAFEQRRAWQRATRERRRDSWEVEVRPNIAWGMAAARLTIPNGFPDAFSNSIVITAGQLRAPLFDPEAPPEVGYGGFGFLLGHEFVHVLENYEFTAQGALHDSWSQDDIHRLEARHACVVEQANQYVVVDALHLNGAATVEENAADLGGVTHAYAVMVQDVGPRLSVHGADGMTPEQRFFISYAQQWCSAQRPAALRDGVRDDGHAPLRFRVNAPLANLPAFAQAFACRAGAPMVRSAADRCTIW
jgi:endothelin-converting enzyme/putative endopeptidase